MQADPSALLAAVLADAAAAVDAAADELTALDSAIGDGDHGSNMKRGFAELAGKLEELAGKPPPAMLKAAGMALVMKIGGASGPLYGTLLMALGSSWPAEPDGASLAAALESAVAAVAKRGKSGPGSKTLLDVLVPVQKCLAAAAAEWRDLPAAADEAAVATVGMKALRGRASFLGERSIGHMDPGARSSALLVRSACETLGRLL